MPQSSLPFALNSQNRPINLISISFYDSDVFWKPTRKGTLYCYRSTDGSLKLFVASFSLSIDEDRMRPAEHSNRDGILRSISTISKTT